MTHPFYEQPMATAHNESTHPPLWRDRLAQPSVIVALAALVLAAWAGWRTMPTARQAEARRAAKAPRSINEPEEQTQPPSLPPLRRIVDLPEVEADEPHLILTQQRLPSRSDVPAGRSGTVEIEPELARP